MDGNLNPYPFLLCLKPNVFKPYDIHEEWLIKYINVTHTILDLVISYLHPLSNYNKPILRKLYNYFIMDCNGLKPHKED